MRLADSAELASVLAGELRVFRVSGLSMTPTLADQDEVVVDPSADPQVGDLVVARHPYKTDCTLVKRVVEISSAARFVLLGDNPSESTDSRSLGTFPRERIIGKVISRLPPA